MGEDRSLTGALAHERTTRASSAHPLEWNEVGIDYAIRTEQ